MLNKSGPEIPVLLCFDGNYLNHAAVASWSAYKSSASNVIFHWFSTKECEEQAINTKKRLEKLGLKINLLSVDLAMISEWKTGYHFTTATYLRLFAPHLLVDCKKIIYLDCDVLVITDMKPLFELNMGESLFAGVIDEGGEVSSKVPRISGDRYINGGVLLMNLEGLRDDGFLEKVQGLYPKIEKQITWADQCLINKYAEGRKIVLDARWNRQIFSPQANEANFQKLANPQISSILHFTGGVKPWQAWCNPSISEYWWRIANELAIDGLKPSPITSVEQLIALGNVQHLNGHFEEASSIKSRAIQSLLDHLRKAPKPQDRGG